MNQNKKNIVQLGQIDIDPAQFNKEPDTDDLLILPTRDLVLFPGVNFPITLNREDSVRTVRTAEQKSMPIGIICQIEKSDDHPTLGQLHKYGVIADVIKMFELPDGSKTAIMHARDRFRVKGPGKTYYGSNYPILASVELLKETMPRRNDKEFDAMVELISSTTRNLMELTSDDGTEMAFNILNSPSPAMMINLIASHGGFDVASKIEMLSKSKIKERAYLLLAQLSKNEQEARLAADIKEQTRRSINDQQKEVFLRHQMDIIQQELYGDENDTEILRRKAEKINLPEEVKTAFYRELNKLSRYNPSSPDYSIQYSYLETLLDLPWNEDSPLSTSLNEAETILDSEHYGLEKVKERIVEQLAVLMNTPDGRSPILCLVGAPGVGKTSLGQSIANALGRKYQRVSLGGLHDESEIRGHRRTYIAAMPGRIIDAIRRAKTKNPVIVLDEIDKMGSDFRGDPAAALLEVLDPEQNYHFHDNYIDVDFDLSKVLFIATANSLTGISQPLLDRMEIIDISGYLLEEKVEIAQRHLIRRLLKDNGFDHKDIEFTPEAIISVIEGYTTESGVRQLEKKLASIIRKIVRLKVSGKEYPRVVLPADVRNLLGVPTFTKDRYEGNDFPGVVTGLAWTSAGGEILYVESSLAPGKGTDKPTLTGNLGDVMKESAIIAFQYVKSHAEKLGIPIEKFEKNSLHIHVPEGAIPKDGPSAGITMVTSIVSSFTGKKVAPRLAMTGEITLRGKVLPVGGIKEKILAAKRAGITDIILCKINRKDIEEIQPRYLEGLNFHYVDTIEEVLRIAILDK